MASLNRTLYFSIASGLRRRISSILLPVSSLPSPYGIGCFSKEAYDFIDWLKEAGQTLWQILPLGPTSYGDSPYQSFLFFHCLGPSETNILIPVLPALPGKPVLYCHEKSIRPCGRYCHWVLPVMGILRISPFPRLRGILILLTWSR